MKNNTNVNSLRLCVFVLLVSCFSTNLQAKEIYFPNARINFWVPNEWNRKFDGEAVSVAEPGGDVLLVISAVEANDLDSVLNDLDTELSKIIDNVTLDGSPTETTVNNMPAAFVEATGQMQGQDVEIGVLIVITPAEKMLLAIGIIDASKTDQYEATLNRVFGGIKGTR